MRATPSKEPATHSCKGPPPRTFFTRLPRMDLSAYCSLLRFFGGSGKTKGKEEDEEDDEEEEDEEDDEEEDAEGEEDT